MRIKNNQRIIKINPASKIKLNIKLTADKSRNIPYHLTNEFSKIPKKVLDKILCEEATFICWLNADESNMKQFIADPLKAVMNSEVYQDRTLISKLNLIRNQHKNNEDIPEGVNLEAITYNCNITYK